MRPDACRRPGRRCDPPASRPHPSRAVPCRPARRRPPPNHATPPAAGPFGYSGSQTSSSPTAAASPATTPQAAAYQGQAQVSARRCRVPLHRRRAGAARQESPHPRAHRGTGSSAARRAAAHARRSAHECRSPACRFPRGGHRRRSRSWLSPAHQDSSARSHVRIPGSRGRSAGFSPGELHVHRRFTVGLGEKPPAHLTGDLHPELKLDLFRRQALPQTLRHLVSRGRNLTQPVPKLPGVHNIGGAAASDTSDASALSKNTSEPSSSSYFTKSAITPPSFKWSRVGPRRIPHAALPALPAR